MYDHRLVPDKTAHKVTRTLTTLEGYYAAPHMFRLLEVFWDQNEVVTSQKGYHGPHLKETSGTTQGGLI